MELAVFRRGDGWAVAVSLSLPVEFRESQENGLVSFRVGGGGAAVEAVAGGGGGGGATAEAREFGLRDGDSAVGDHGIEGRALVMLLRDIVLLGCSFSTGLLVSLTALVDWDTSTCDMHVGRGLVPACGGASSSKLTLSRFEVLEIRFDREDSRRVFGFSSSPAGSPLAPLAEESSSPSGTTTGATDWSPAFSRTASSSVGLFSGGAGFEVDTDRFVSDRTGLSSTASSKVSCSTA